MPVRCGSAKAMRCAPQLLMPGTLFATRLAGAGDTRQYGDQAMREPSDSGDPTAKAPLSMSVPWRCRADRRLSTSSQPRDGALRHSRAEAVGRGAATALRRPGP